MPKSQGQKCKLLYLMKILLEETDEAHPLPRARITGMLAERYGVEVERKTFYDDMECLSLFGLDIVRESEGYYIGSRTFQMPELRLLADAVGCSQFISEKKSRELIGKLASLCSAYQGASLRRQIDVATRNKTVSETVYYAIDAIYTAKNEGRQISFVYFGWSPDERGQPVKVYRHGGARYLAAPLAVVWDEEKYYLIALDRKTEEIRHYRVDKMEKLALEPAAPLPAFAEAFRPNEYTARLFNMYGGEPVQITLRFDKALLGVMIDRFGHAASFRPDGNDTLLLIATVAVSPQFCGWLFSLEDGVEIVRPVSLRKAFADKIRRLRDIYE